MKKNLFFTLCFSFCPGAGQMYQGYMKRGVSILTLFAVCFGIFVTIDIPLFAIPLPVIFIYSFFDTFNIRSLLGTDEKLKDKYIWEENSVFNFKFGTSNSTFKKLLGIILVFIGGYILLYNGIPPILRLFGFTKVSQYINIIGSCLTPIIISIISIYFGAKLIIRK